MNELKELAAFQKILAHYEPGDVAKELLKETKLVLLSAPTSVGRNTVIRALLKTGKYHFIVSDTTRHPRVNNGVLEQNGREYWFRSEADILADLRAGKYIEAAIIHNQQVSGISSRELQAANQAHQTPINDIEVVGVQNIMNMKPDTVAIFMLPPSFDEWMSRLHGRGVIEKPELHRRLRSALKEFVAALTHPYYRFIINERVGQTADEVDHLIGYSSLSKDLQMKGRTLAEQLYQETRIYLNKLS